nr:methyltransferase domain-containing protein [Streptomyces davaonensis]
MPFEDGAFDTVMSCVGVMFAPHHQAAADELVRVCRPGAGSGCSTGPLRGSSVRCSRR